MSKHALLFLVLVAGLLLAPPALAQQSEALQFDPEVPIPGVFEGEQTVDNDFTGKYISGLYVYFVWIVGALAVVMVIYGGIKWVAASGNPARINDARDVINNAIIGVIIALVSVVLLNLISPQFTSIGLPDLAGVTPNPLATGYNPQRGCYESLSCGPNYDQTEAARCFGGTTRYVDPNTSACGGNGAPHRGICCRDSDTHSNCFGVSVITGEVNWTGKCLTPVNTQAPSTACTDTTLCSQIGSLSDGTQCYGVQCSNGGGCYINVKVTNPAVPNEIIGGCVSPESYYTFRNLSECNNTRYYYTQGANCGQLTNTFDGDDKAVVGIGLNGCATDQYCAIYAPQMINGQCAFAGSAGKCVKIQ